jgi:hypothetical protein
MSGNSVDELFLYLTLLPTNDDPMSSDENWGEGGERSETDEGGGSADCRVMNAEWKKQITYVFYSAICNHHSTFPPALTPLVCSLPSPNG